RLKEHRAVVTALEARSLLLERLDDLSEVETGRTAQPRDAPDEETLLNVDDVEHLPQVDSPDDGSSPGRALEQPLRDQVLQGMANRRPAHVELASQPLLTERAAGRELAEQDP